MFRAALQRASSSSTASHLRSSSITTPYLFPWHISRYSTSNNPTTRPDVPLAEPQPSSNTQTIKIENHPNNYSDRPSSSAQRDDQVVAVKEKLRDWSHQTATLLRHRSDTFTRKVAVTFAQLGSELNRVTGYGEIEILKKRVVEQGMIWYSVLRM